jgi:hypothetical protein
VQAENIARFEQPVAAPGIPKPNVMSVNSQGDLGSNEKSMTMFRPVPTFGRIERESKRGPNRRSSSGSLRKSTQPMISHFEAENSFGSKTTIMSEKSQFTLTSSNASSYYVNNLLRAAAEKPTRVITPAPVIIPATPVEPAPMLLPPPPKSPTGNQSVITGFKAQNWNKEFYVLAMLMVLLIAIVSCFVFTRPAPVATQTGVLNFITMNYP